MWASSQDPGLGEVSKTEGVKSHLQNVGHCIPLSEGIIGEELYI